MKIVKGFKLYRIKEKNSQTEYTTHVNLEDLNNALKGMGYTLKIKGFFKPFKFHNFRHNRTYSFDRLFKLVADEFFVSYSYVIDGATEEELERLSGKKIQIRRGHIEEYTAAMILHGTDWLFLEEYNETIFQGILYKLNRETGYVEEIEKLVSLPINMPRYIGDVNIEYID